MYDVNLLNAIIGIQNTNVASNYAAQDLETQNVGKAIPFAFSVETGFVFLALDFITDVQTIGQNAFDSQDMEALPIGTILFIPASILPTTIPPVYLLQGNFTPMINYTSDDFESYAIGTFLTATNTANTGLGDITAVIGSTRTGP